MTEEKIIKALELCSQDTDCLWENECPLVNDKNFHTTLAKATLELLKKYKNEIVRERGDSVGVFEMLADKIQKEKPIGKFKDTDALQKAYESLEKEFTKRSQKLAKLKTQVDEKTCKNIAKMNPVDGFTCSKCGITIVDYVEERFDEEKYDTTYHAYAFKYCPNCGAKVVN